MGCRVPHRIALAALLLAALLRAPPGGPAAAGRAFAEEPPPGAAAPAEEAIDPVRVGRLLLDPDPEARARGRALLLRRIEQGGDLEAFLEAMSAAQAAWLRARGLSAPETPAAAEAPVPAERAPAPEGRDTSGPAAEAGVEQRAAPRAPAPAPQPEGEARAEDEPAEDSDSLAEALRRALRAGRTAAAGEAAAPARPATATRADDEDETPGQAQQDAALPAVERLVVDVEREAAAAWLALRPDGAAAARQLRAGQPVVLEGPAAAAAFDAAPALLEARLLARGRAPLATPLVAGERIRWRRALVRTGKGAWAVEAEDLTRGVEVRARLDPAPADAPDARPDLVVEATRTAVPLPLPVARVRPGEDVDPVELDRPEWEVVRVRAARPWSGAAVAFFLPGLVADRVLIVALEP